MGKKLIAQEDNRPKWKKNFSKGMVAFAFVAQTWLVIQVVELYQKKDAGDISVPAFGVYMVVSAVWFLYGLLAFDHVDYVLMISSTIAFILATLIIIATQIYDNEHEDDGSPTPITSQRQESDPRRPLRAP